MKPAYNLFKGKLASCFILYSFCLIIMSCKKMVEIDAPFTSTNEYNVYSDDANAIAVMTGMYTQMMNSTTFNGNSGISLFTGISADELTLYGGVTDQKYLAYYKNNLTGNANVNFGSDFWSPLYNYIFVCNAVIEGVSSSTSLSSAVKKELMGEAKFMRAFFYFYLTNLFGDIPLVTTTDYKENYFLEKSSKAIVYQQIFTDLIEAQNDLSDKYLKGDLITTYSIGGEERVRPTKWAASALLARAYLYGGDYANAETQATIVINNSTLFGLETLSNVFLKNKKEAIWQLQPVKSGRNTDDAIAFILTSSGPTTSTSRPVYVSSILLNSFETSDQRKTNWIKSVTTSSGATYNFPNKYKNNTATVTEYLMVLRLAEQYLIRAEARAQLGDIIGAKSDLNAIRNRAMLGSTLANDKPTLLNAILHEKQVELFTEWGSRWLELKRTSNIDAVMNVVTPLKANGAPWQSYQQFYPLPWTDIIRGINLKQNFGY